MSVATKNPFALLSDETSRPSSPAPAKSAPAPPAPAPSASRGSQKPRTTGPASRGGKYYNRGGAKPSSGPREGAGADDEGADGQRKFDSGRGRGRGRGDRRGGGRGGDRPARGRAFDRHSQSGKVDSEKKVNQGWGGEQGTAELKAEQAAEVDAAAEAAQPRTTDDWSAAANAQTDDWSAPAAAGDADATTPKEGGRPSRREREPEEEDNTLTLDQYFAQKKEKEESVVPKLEGVRQANEGADPDLWKGATALSKGEEEEAYFVGKGKSAPKPRTKKEEKVYLEIDARFERPSRGGDRGRGGRGERRGGERGGRGRGGARGGNNNNNNSRNLSVDDQSAFPSLS